MKLKAIYGECVSLSVTVCTGALNLNPQTTRDQWRVEGWTELFKVVESHTHTQ